MSSPEDPLIEIALMELLGQIAEATGGVHAEIAPQNPEAVAPYLIFQRIITDRWKSLDGPSDMAQPTFQIDSYAPTKIGALRMKDAVRKLLDGYRGTVAGVRIGGISIQNELSTVDETAQPKLFRTMQEYLITHDEA